MNINNQPRATALIVKDHSVLMIQRYKNGEHFFALPGGSVEENESIEQAVVRELYEETTIRATIKEKVLEFVTKTGRPHHVYLCEYISGEPKLAPNSPEVGWTRKENTYLPRWVKADELEGATIWPDEERELIKKAVNR